MISLRDVQNHPIISQMIYSANEVLAKRGYTEHGPRHMGYVCKTAGDILAKLDYPARMVELARIAGWVHDVGNCINRTNHGLTGATLIVPILSGMGMPIDEVCAIASAVGNHEEQNGIPVSEISAALIIADKADAHRTRVRRGQYNPNEIHDRVNYSISHNWIEVEKDARIIHFGITMDSTSSYTDFLDIYMSRMRMCEDAAKLLGCKFQIDVNGAKMNN